MRGAQKSHEVRHHTLKSVMGGRRVISERGRAKVQPLSEGYHPQLVKDKALRLIKCCGVIIVD